MALKGTASLGQGRVRLHVPVTVTVSPPSSAASGCCGSEGATQRSMLHYADDCLRNNQIFGSAEASSPSYSLVGLLPALTALESVCLPLMELVCSLGDRLRLLSRLHAASHSVGSINN